jgi:hypothetical protein
MTSSTLKPASKFSNTVATGIRVSLNTHAPLTLPGMLSTAGHWDQSRFAIFVPSFHRNLVPQFDSVVTRGKTRAGASGAGCERRSLPLVKPLAGDGVVFRVKLDADP